MSDKLNKMDTKECTMDKSKMMDTRECLVTGLKQAYATINSLNATSRKISAAKAILLMKRDKVRHEMDGLTRRLTAMLAIMHSNLEKEIGKIVKSKTEYLENWEQHIFETICKIGELCIQTEHALKIENEQCVDKNAYKLIRQLQVLCQAGLDPDTASHFENSVRIEFVPGVLEEIIEYSTLGDLLTSNVEDIGSKNTKVNSSNEAIHSSDVVNNNKETVQYIQTSESSDCNKTNTNRCTRNQKSADGNGPSQITSAIFEVSDSIEMHGQVNKRGQLVATRSNVDMSKYAPAVGSQSCKFNNMTDKISYKHQETSTRENGATNLNVVTHEHHSSGDVNLASDGNTAIREAPNANRLRVLDDVLISRPTLNMNSSLYTRGRGRSRFNSVELSSKMNNRSSSNIDHSSECDTLEPATPEKKSHVPVMDTLMSHGTRLNNSQDNALQSTEASNTHKTLCPQSSPRITMLPISDKKKIPSDGQRSSVTECWDEETNLLKRAHLKGSSGSIHVDSESNSRNLNHQPTSGNISSVLKGQLKNVIVKTEPKSLEYQINGGTKESDSYGHHKTSLSVPSSPLKELTDKTNGESKKSIISGTMKNVLKRHIQSNEAQSTQQVGDANNNLTIKKESLDNGSVYASKNNLTIKKEPLDHTPICAIKTNLAIKKESLDNMATCASTTSANNTVVKASNSSSDSRKSPMKRKPEFVTGSAISLPQTKHMNPSSPKKSASKDVPVHPVLPVKSKQHGIDFSRLVGCESVKQVAQLGTPKIGTKPLFQFPIGITTNNHEEVIVCDSGAGMIRVFKYNCQLFSISNGKEGEKLVHPSAVVVNENDDIFVKDDFAIHVFDRSGNPLKNIGKKVLKHPYGLAMTSNGKLVVVDVDKRRPTLYLFNQDGTVASSPVFSPLVKPKAGSKCRFLSLYEDKILVSDLGLSQMYLVNLDGVLISTFGTFGRHSGCFNEPSGVTVDSVGNWIVADSKNDRLQIFKPDGTFLSHLKLSSPICRPSDIHLTADGHLFVVNFLYHVVNVYKIHQ